METMYYIGLDVHKKTIDYCSPRMIFDARVRGYAKALAEK